MYECFSSPDEHQSAGQHRDAELSPPAPLHQDLPGSPGAAGLPGLPESPEACPSHLDLQPQRHPHGPRRQGAPLHGLNQIHRPPSPAPVIVSDRPGPVLVFLESEMLQHGFCWWSL